MDWASTKTMKCGVCSKKIPELFLSKIDGTVVKDAKGKKKYLCSECQSKLKTKEEMLAAL